MFSICLNSQTKRQTKFNLGLDIATPTTDAGYRAYETGFGGTVKALFPTGKQSYITATTGIIRFAGRGGDPQIIFGISFPNINIAVPPYTVIPFKVGYLTPFSSKSKWYFEIEAGYTLGEILGVNRPVKSSEVSGVTGAIGFGRQVIKGFELGLRYEAFPASYNLQDYASFVSLRSLMSIEW